MATPSSPPHFITILIHILCTFIFLQQTTCFNNQTDLHSLLAIKSAITDDPLGALDSWNETTHFCRWNGIRCSRAHPGRVVGINLISQGLVGSLSPHVGNLSFLTTLHLQNNTFHGHIPQQISLLTTLQSLILENNSFVGAIPQNLSQCRKLFHLSFSDNELSGPIPDLGSLSELKTLVLARNYLSGPIPPSIGNLTSLQQISFLTCGLTGEIPASFAQLRRLIFLQLSNNAFTGTVPSSLFNISTLKYFYAASNELRGILPSDLGVTLPNLEGLYLWGNKFSGPIPSSISNASFLGFIDLSLNNLTGPLPRVEKLTNLRSFIFESNFLVDDLTFFPSLINSTELESVGVGDNRLRGALPESVANLSTRLSSLYIYQNEIYGSIPLGIGNLIGLTSLYLSINDFDGPIPTSIGKLSALIEFDGHGNGFNDALPFSFGNLTSLSSLHLSGNRFWGNLPSSLGNCTNLKDLDLSHNNFSGLIPQQLVALSSLSIMLNLSYNNFDGLIPNEVGLLRNLGSLDLSNNRLSGAIPDSLGQCTSLEQLHLGENLLQGEIPAGMSGLEGLLVLDLSRNNLSGTIPDFLGELNLERLNLSFNRLQGEVPRMGVFMNKSSVSIDGNYELCGGIPELELPPCAVVRSQNTKLSTLLKILIPLLVLGGISLVLLAIFITYNYKKRMSRRNVTSLSPFTAGTEIMRLSYGDLIKATEGFCEANKLGFGRFGSVFGGTLEDGETRVAVKVLNLSVRGASESFFAECNSLRNLRHRNVLKILSVCESIDFQGNEFKALVYEFKVNGSLEKWLYRCREEEGEHNAETSSLELIHRLNIAIDIAQALEYLHIGMDSSIVHGDLKPSNILLDHDMIAYIGDFGLAKVISDMVPSHESSSIGITGTLGYVAPEYATNNFISTQGDVYSYGILVLEMFTNKRPTDEEFMDHVNLHSFVSDALSSNTEEFVGWSIHPMNPKVEDCFKGILRIGVACSRTMQQDRMLITHVVKDLCKIRDFYLS